MPIIVSATGPEPASQDEIEERRQARLAKNAAGIAKKKNKKKTTEGMTNVQKLSSAIFDRKLIKFVLTPDPAVKASGWPDAPTGLHVVLPGINGHKAYIFKIKDRLKEADFQWNPHVKLWWKHAPDSIDNQTFE